jgi:peptide/nickel transport system permease protein/oligopeptide transport system permease protein
MSEPRPPREWIPEPWGDRSAPFDSRPGVQAWQRFAANRAALAALIVASAIVVAVLIGPAWLAHAPLAMSDAQFSMPSRQHWLGTDAHGRDLLSRVLHGGRISLLVGLIGAGVSLCIGVTWGAAAGYLGGRWDNVLMRVVDVLYSLPSIILVIVLLAAIEAWVRDLLPRDRALVSGASVRLCLLFLGLGAVSWLNMARIVRGQVLSLRNQAFVQASEALGASHLHILRRHILPHVAGVVITYLTLSVPAIVLYESFLSFLGLGVQPPHASLGSLIAEGAMQINPIRIYWWLLVFPAGFLALTLLTFNFLGDGLRDLFDPVSSPPDRR